MQNSRPLGRLFFMYDWVSAVLIERVLVACSVRFSAA